MHANLEFPVSTDASRPSSQLRCEWIADEEQFRRLEDEWMNLFRRSASLSAFVTFDWMYLWWKHWGKSRELRIIAVRDQSAQLVGLAPFYLARPFLGPAHLRFLADEHVGSDYLTLLAEPGWEKAVVREIRSMLERHCAEFACIELRDAEQSPLLDLFCAELQDAGMRIHVERASICYYLDLPPSFDAFLASISINLRANFRRRWRNLQRDQQGELLAFSSPEGISGHLPDLFELHRLRFLQRGVESAFLRSGVPEFHTQAVRALSARGWVRLYLLRAGGQDIAALYGFSIKGGFQFFQCGMHADQLGQFGAGQVLMGNVIRESIESGHTGFDFLRGGESYKSKWADKSRYTVNVHGFDTSPAGWTAHALFHLRQWFRAVRSFLRRSIDHARRSVSNRNAVGGK